MRLSILALALSAGATLSPSAGAQASFAEGFDGQTTQSLEAQGWSFRNQSSAPGPLGWRTDDTTQPYEGTHYLVTDGYCVQAGAIGSNWAVLPPISGQIAGDELVFFLAEGWTLLRSDVMQVRYSPSGGDSTGSSATDVGDFDVLLAEFPHDTVGWWGEHRITLPGPGRIAFRFYVPDGRAAGMYVDSLTVGDPPGGSVPLPQAGETVHWTPAMSPVRLDAGVTNLVEGGTVIVDPRVTVEIPTGATLDVRGSLRFLEGSRFVGAPGAQLAVTGGRLVLSGTSRFPVEVEASSNFMQPGILASAGARVIFDGVLADVFTWVSSSATCVVERSRFRTNQAVGQDVAGFRTFDGTLALRDSSFVDCGILEEGGYLLFDRCAFVNSPLILQRATSPQTLFLDRLTATGSTARAPFEIHRFDVLFGEHNRIEGNLYPVRLESGGLAPGSVLPNAGNAFNSISGVARIGSRSTWANVGLPYVLEHYDGIVPLSGQLTIEPGVTARFERDPGSVTDPFPIFEKARLVARGTPDEPIVLTHAGQGWGGLIFGDNDGKRSNLRHVHVDSADYGVMAKACTVRLVDCTLEGNTVGAQSNSAGWIQARGTRFLANGTGVETSPGAGGSTISAGRADLRGGQSANEFVGNLQGVRVENFGISVNASNNWWGDSSGASHPQNPGGTGDSATANVDVSPHRTVVPPRDSAPLVRLERIGDIQEEGNRLILRWEVEDDGTLVEQRIEYTPHGMNPPLAPLVTGIAPNVRTLEIVVPPSPPSSNIALPVLRVVAIDDAGQEGWDEAQFFTPYEDQPIQFDVSPVPDVLRPGERVDVCWSLAFGDAYLMLDDIDWAISLGGTTTDCLPLGLKVPGVSCDTARIAVVHRYGAGGRVHYEYSEPFSIRPDAMIGDRAPSVHLLSPVATSFASPGSVPIAWNASDDEGLRSFTIQASYDGGRGWNSLVEGLPGNASTWTWDLPPSGGIADVRVRVVATDLRFQTSSAETTIEILPAP